MIMMTNHPTGQVDDHGRATKLTNGDSRPSSVRFSHLPPDVLYKIASKLPPKEFARTSVLSSEWRRISSACPRLTFDAVEICKCDREDIRHHICQFIDKVNAVLQTHQGKVVETLEVRIDFLNSRLLAHHIDTWVDFAVSSRTKNLTLDLKRDRFPEYKYRYVFPFQLLDTGSISRLRHMQLSFISWNPPPQFKGFPNLRKLHLQGLHVTRKDLENLLSCCCTLEWLCIDRCQPIDELTVDSPLPRLLYLRVDCCRLTKIKFNATNLATFECDGSITPIDLVHSSNLKSANIDFRNADFQHVLTSLLNGLPSVQNLTLNIGSAPYLEKRHSWDNQLKFSNLRHLQLSMYVWREYAEKVLYLALFLRATPFIEKLEVHFASFGLWLAEVGPCRKDVGQCKYNYLKDIWITGFKAARGQLEFLLHIVENAPALEVVLVEICEPRQRRSYGASGPTIQKVKQVSRTCLSRVLSQNVTFDVK